MNSRENVGNNFILLLFPVAVLALLGVFGIPGEGSKPDIRYPGLKSVRSLGLGDIGFCLLCSLFSLILVLRSAASLEVSSSKL